MNRRMLLAIVLSIVAIAGYSWVRRTLFPTPTEVAPKEGPNTAPPPNGAGPEAGMDGPGMAAPPPGPAPAPAPQDPPRPAAPSTPVRPEQEFVVEPATGEFKDVGFTSRGGAIRFVRLRNDFELPTRDAPVRQPIDLLLPSRPDLLTGAVSLDEADAEGLRTSEWTREASASETVVVFSQRTAGGLRIVKTYTLPTEKGRYDVAIEIRVERAGAKGGATPENGGRPQRLRLLGVAGLAHEPTAHTSFEEPTQCIVQVTGRHTEPYLDPWHVNPIEIDKINAASFRLLGLKTQYFAAVLYSGGGTGAAPVRRIWAEGGDLDKRMDYEPALDRLLAFYQARGRDPLTDPALKARIEHSATWFHRAWVEFEPPIGTEGQAQAGTTFRLYVGPMSRHVVAQDGYEPLREMVVYPMAFDFLARFLLLIFDLFHWLTSSAGLAVLLMTLVVRGGLIPLSVRNQLSMRRHGRKVSRLKPKLEALKKKWASDPKRFREEQVKLFREHGIGFPLGCLMLVFQIPIFMALFSSLRVEYDLRHQAFLWIRDLSGPDRLLDFGLSHPLSLIGIPPGGIYALNLLPLLYMGLAILQQRQMPKPLDEQQAQQMKMAKWMTIIFPVLLYNYTAALALYMVVSSTVAIVESRLVRRKDLHDVEREAAAHA